MTYKAKSPLPPSTVDGPGPDRAPATTQQGPIEPPVQRNEGTRVPAPAANPDLPPDNPIARAFKRSIDAIERRGTFAPGQ